MKRLLCVWALCVGCNFTSRPMLPTEFDDASVDPTDSGRTPGVDAPVAAFDTSFPTDTQLPPPSDVVSTDLGLPVDASAPQDTAPATDAPAFDVPGFDASADAGTMSPCDNAPTDAGPDAGDAIDARACDDASDAGDADDADDAGDASDADRDASDGADR